MRGSKPAANTLKILEAVRASEINFGEAKPPAGYPAAPGFLDSEAKAEFMRVAELLDAMRALSRAEGPCLGLYAMYVPVLQAAAAIVKEKGPVIATPRGNQVPNPAWHVMRQALQDMFHILRELGLTPISRPRLRIQTSTARDELEDFLKRG
jgi:P27 family predicted phage terminase small subunit